MILIIVAKQIWRTPFGGCFCKVLSPFNGQSNLILSTINENHMMYDSCDMKQGRQNFFSFWTIFCPFAPPSPPLVTTHRIKNFEKMKKNTWRYHHFTQVYHKWQWYDVWFLRYGARQTECFLILDHILPFYPPNNPEN